MFFIGEESPFATRAADSSPLSRMPLLAATDAVESALDADAVAGVAPSILYAKNSTANNAENRTSRAQAKPNLQPLRDNRRAAWTDDGCCSPRLGGG